jgi:hypothetical protein
MMKVEWGRMHAVGAERGGGVSRFFLPGVTCRENAPNPRDYIIVMKRNACCDTREAPGPQHAGALVPPAGAAPCSRWSPPADVLGLKGPWLLTGPLPHTMHTGLQDFISCALSHQTLLAI